MIFSRLRKLVERAESYLKTDLRYIVKGGFWLTSSKLVTLLASLITSVVFANVLSKETYGVYSYVLSIVGIFTIATLNGLDTALTKSVAQGAEGSFISIVYTKIRWGVLGSLGSVGFAWYYFSQGDVQLALCFLVVAAFIPFMDSFYLYVAYLNGKKAFHLNAKYHTIGRLVVVPVLLATVFLTQNAVLILLVYFGIYTLIRFIFLQVTLARTSPNVPTDTTVISFGKHLSLISVIDVFSTSLDKILIFHFAGPAALAGYYLALTPLKQIRGFIDGLNDLAFPKFSTKSHVLLRKTLLAKVLKLCALVVPVIALYCALAPLLFRLIFPKYLEYARVSQLFMLLLIFFPFTLLHTAITSWGGRNKLYLISMGAAFTRITLLLVLVPMFGLYGAVATIMLTTAIGGLLTLYSFLDQRQHATPSSPSLDPLDDPA